MTWMTTGWADAQERDTWIIYLKQLGGPAISVSIHWVHLSSEYRGETDSLLVCENARLKCVFGIPLSSESLVCVDTPKRAVRLNMEMARKISVRNPRKPPSSKKKKIPKVELCFIWGYYQPQFAQMNSSTWPRALENVRKTVISLNLWDIQSVTGLRCLEMIASVKGVGTWKW